MLKTLGISFSCYGQGSVIQAILYVDSYFSPGYWLELKKFLLDQKIFHFYHICLIIWPHFAKARPGYHANMVEIKIF